MKILALLTFLLTASSGLADDTNAIFQTNFQHLIGRPLNSSEMRLFLSHFSDQPFQEWDNTDSNFPDNFEYNFLKEGISLAFRDYKTESGPILYKVFLFSQNDQGYTPYKGPLPCGLSFDMTRGDIEKKFGPPGQSNGIHLYNAVYYPTKFIGFYYVTNSEQEASDNMKIFDIILE